MAALGAWVAAPADQYAHPIDPTEMWAALLCQSDEWIGRIGRLAWDRLPVIGLFEQHLNGKSFFGSSDYNYSESSARPRHLVDERPDS